MSMIKVGRTIAILPALTLALAACSEQPSTTGLAPVLRADRPPLAALSCDVNVALGTVSCAELAGALPTMAAKRMLAPGSASTERQVAGGQGLLVRMTSAASTYTGEVLSVPVTVQNLSGTPYGSPDGVSRHNAGVQVYFVAPPTTTSGTGSVTVANADGVGVFTASNQAFFQYGGQIGGVDQPELGADGILSPGEVSSIRTWQFNLPATVTTFSFQVYVSTETLPATHLATIAPQVTAISASPLVPGASVQLTGYNFNATPATNVVRIGGQTATVTGGDLTHLTVTVPCTSSGSVLVNVTDAGKRGVDFTAALQVAQRTLAVGQSVILSSAAESACNELTSAAGPARYVLSVVNAATSPSNTAPFSFSADGVVGADAGEPLANRLGEASLVTPSRVKTMGGQSIMQIIDAAAEQRRNEKHDALLEQNARLYQTLRAKFGTAGRVRRGGSRDVVAADPALTRTFRVSNINATAPNNICNSYYVVSATRVFYDGKLAIYEDDATPDAFKSSLNPTMAANYLKIGNQFNADMEPIVRTNFGDILRRDAVTDNNGIEIALFTPRINTSFSGVAGYVVSCDQFPNDDVDVPAVGGPYTGSAGSTNGASNFGEFFYAYQPVTAGSGYSGNTPDNWYRTIRSTFIHESKHIASMAARVANNAPSYEAAWLEEGMARTSEELWMRNAVDNVAWKANTGYGSAANPVNLYCDARPTGWPECDANPRRPANIMARHFQSLYTTLFGTNARLLSPFGPTASDNASYYYANSWSLIRYTTDRYGASDAAFLGAVTNATTSGATSLAALSGVSIDRILGGWSLAFATDDYPGMPTSNADIQQPTWNFRSIYAGLNADFPSTYTLPYPQLPTVVSFGTVAPVVTTTLYGGGIRYFQFAGTQTAPQLVRLQGNGAAALPTNIRLSVARVE